MKFRVYDMKRIVLLLISTMLVIVSAGCSSEAAEGYRVGTWKTAQTIQPFYYENYLEEHIEVLPFTNPGDQKTALLAGDLDMTGTTLVTAITAASKGEPVVIVTALCNKCSALVVGAESGIDSVDDLKGKRIAYVPGTMHHILLLETLESAGLDLESDVDLVRIDFFDMGQSLANGDIDAFCSGEPFPSVAEMEGYGRVLAYPYFDDSIGTINGAMITTRDKINNARDRIQALVNAHVQASEELESDVEFWLTEAEEFGTDKDVLANASRNMELAWNIDEDYIKKAEKLAERMLELGIISDMPDMEVLFDTSFVENIKTETEGIN
ncbi:NitT/TauT family transport system substrate-binding protein [Dethiosulfatibacter aminovorans DSM 17477]|uniref:NitT/TauT family transport system substrate-binding protein n=1 Tax=Dethiosulfatibacter aminovorans DSM 17477 TaxID=1121476 RepID=A0A1M6F6E4_9FIRM|nr:NrtA/SsuA/CpmA family ABC transporter substrate-binding protein [Dethiosulfatibacter aminovorans]SHI93277.1 NitT/TauT family transport system substrate-binding protein [Dethiosulfatibacter aminovorans DSM 17477]